MVHINQASSFSSSPQSQASFLTPSRDILPAYTDRSMEDPAKEIGTVALLVTAAINPEIQKEAVLK